MGEADYDCSAAAAAFRKSRSAPAQCTGGYNVKLAEPIAPYVLPVLPSKKAKQPPVMDLLGDMSLEAFIRNLRRK